MYVDIFTTNQCVQLKLSAISVGVMPHTLSIRRICKPEMQLEMFLLSYCNTVEEIIPIQHETVDV